MPSKVCDEITYPFANFNAAAIEVWEWIGNAMPHFIIDAITYPWPSCHLSTTNISGCLPYWGMNKIATILNIAFNQ